VADVVTMQRCEYYNQRNCESADGECYAIHTCQDAGLGRRTHCYVFWSNSSTQGIVRVILKGCWLDTPACYNQSACIATREQTPGKYFCCCERDLCNANFSISPHAVMLSASATHPPPLGNWRCAVCNHSLSLTHSPPLGDWLSV